MDERILLVDDDLNLLRGYERLYGRRFALACATGGREGLEVLRRQGPFAVVVADRRMPDMDGLEFLAQAAILAPAAVLIMLTGDAEDQEAIQTLRAGRIFRYLAKPCPREEMTAALTEALRHYREAASAPEPASHRGGETAELRIRPAGRIAGWFRRFRSRKGRASHAA